MSSLKRKSSLLRGPNAMDSIENTTSGLVMSEIQAELANLQAQHTAGLEAAEAEATNGMDGDFAPSLVGTMGFEEPETTSGFDENEPTNGYEDELQSYIPVSAAPSGAFAYPPQGLYKTPSYSFAPAPTSGMGYLKPDSRMMYDTPAPFTGVLGSEPPATGLCGCVRCHSKRDHKA